MLLKGFGSQPDVLKRLASAETLLGTKHICRPGQRERLLHGKATHHPFPSQHYLLFHSFKSSQEFHTHNITLIKVKNATITTRYIFQFNMCFHINFILFIRLLIQQKGIGYAEMFTIFLQDFPNFSGRTFQCTKTNSRGNIQGKHYSFLCLKQT